MALSNCVRCGSLFSKMSRPICPGCVRKEDAQLEEANQWLRDNPGKTISALSDSTGISRHQILKWVRQKRVLLADKSEVMPCKRCGDIIWSGIFCDRCKLDLAHSVGEGIRVIREGMSQEEVRKGMHYRPGEREKKTRF